MRRFCKDGVCKDRVLNGFSSTAIVVSMAVMLLLLATGASQTQAHDPRDRVRIASKHDFKTTLEVLGKARKANKMGLVTRASAQAGAKSLGITIPGNQVWGLYNPHFAVRMLKASVDAGFEAPIRLYITEAKDGSVTVSYKKPSVVFGPYGSADLDKMAKELDTIFAKIANSVR